MAESDGEPDRTIFERRDPLIGNTFADRFRIDARLAAGGFGAIYRATELASGQEIALKVLHASLTADPMIVARFRREGQTLATLRDPHTVTAYELGEAPDGTLYIVMELLRGETLYDAFRKHGGPLPWRRVATIARAVCSSLAEAHERGIVHRDLKPANIHLQEKDGTTDFVKVLDFGIAKILRGSDLDPRDLTLAGQMIGTFDYMAPEQMLGGTVGARCDIYTLGVVMYEMITGRLPFAEATSPTHLIAMVLTTSPPPVTGRAPVPPALDRIVMRCLEREQQDRYQNVAELAEALDRVLQVGPHDEATLTTVANPIAYEELTRPARGGAPTHLTPARGAQLRAAIAPAHPIEPLDVRAQGSQPVIASARMPYPYPQQPPQVQQQPPQVQQQPPQYPQVQQPQLPPPPFLQPVVPREAAYPAGAEACPSAPMMPYLDRHSQPVLEAGPPWPMPPTHRRIAGPTFDAARDAAVRRIVWGLVLVLGFVLLVIVAKLL